MTNTARSPGADLSRGISATSEVHEAEAETDETEDVADYDGDVDMPYVLCEN